MKLKVKKLNDNAIIPTNARKGDAGMDLTAVSVEDKNHFVEYGTGLAVEIKSGYVGLLFPRSSISKTGHRLLNSVGVIDSGYRGEIRVRMSHTDRNAYKVGDRVAQLIIMKLPSVSIEEVDSLLDSDRGEGGFGSSGN